MFCLTDDAGAIDTEAEDAGLWETDLTEEASVETALDRAAEEGFEFTGSEETDEMTGWTDEVSELVSIGATLQDVKEETTATQIINLHKPSFIFIKIPLTFY